MAVVMVMGISRTGHSTPKIFTANEVLGWCESNNEERVGCVYYLLGFLQGVHIANEGRKMGQQLCWPKSVTAGQLFRMFVKSANENPEKLHLDANSFIFAVTAKPFWKSTVEGSCPD
jgi:hypothetical protein